MTLGISDSRFWIYSVIKNKVCYRSQEFRKPTGKDRKDIILASILSVTCCSITRFYAKIVINFSHRELVKLILKVRAQI